VLNGRIPDIPGTLVGDDPVVRSAREQFLRRYNMDFANELQRRYDQFYRGTKAVEQRARTYILYDDVIVEGTMLSMVSTRNSSIPGAVNVTFTIVVHDRAFIGTSLLDTGEQTLSALLDGKVRDVEVSKIVTPTVVPPRNTFEQLDALYDINQDGVLTLQEDVTKLQESRDAILAEDLRLQQEEAAAEEAELVALQFVALAETDEDLDAAIAGLAFAQKAKEDLAARRQQLGDVLASTEDDLELKSAELTESESDQELYREQADQSSGSPKFSCPDGYEPGPVVVQYDFITQSENFLVQVSVFPDGAIGGNGETDIDEEFGFLDELLVSFGGVFTAEQLRENSSMSKSVQETGCVPE
jgi:hypothetical protein